MKVFTRIIIALFILSLIALYVIIYAIPGVTGALAKTEVLKYGNLRIEDNVTCYFVRTERVYSAMRPGSIDYYIGDGVHVKKGTRILGITYNQPEDEEVREELFGIIARLGDDSVRLADYLSEFNGMTSYFIDGYENYFTPETMKELKYDDVSALDLTVVNVVRNTTIKDEPLYKICDIRQWHIVCWIEATNISKYSKGKPVIVEMPLGQVEAEVEDIIEDGDKWLIILSTDRYYEEFNKVRAVRAAVVPSDFYGIIIKNESITVSDGVVGVYIKAKNGEYVFRPIKIITTDGKNSIVEMSFFYNDDGEKVGTVNIYDEILVNPGGIERGII